MDGGVNDMLDGCGDVATYGGNVPEKYEND